ncbi:MAG: hypothetical protein AAGD25_00960 [Cyanobacteria bacterium P01_F01_bin.150]
MSVSFGKLSVLLGASVLLSNCAGTQAIVVETAQFRLMSDPVDYQDLDSPSLLLEEESFPLSFYDFDPDWERIIRTVTVQSVQSSGRPRIVLDKNGHAYQIAPGPEYLKVDGRPVMADTPLNWYAQGPTITIEPGNNTLLLPLLEEHSYKTVQAEIERTGGQVLGIFGTTFKGFEPGTKAATALSYHYFNPNRLSQNQGEELPIYRSSDNSGQSAPNILLSGIVTYQDGRIEYLDFSHLEGAGEMPDEKLESIKQQIRPELEHLEQRPDVVAFTIDTHGVIRHPDDIEAVFERGGGRRGGPFLFHETQSVARGLRIFDDQTKEYLGSMITPSLLMHDALKVAKQKYGPNAVIQFLDGDAPAAAYFEETSTGETDFVAELGIQNPQVLNHFRLRGAKGLELLVSYE